MNILKASMLREPQVEERVRNYLTKSGYELLPRYKTTGPDILAKKGGRTLLVEVKGDRPGHKSSPGTINVDVMTLLGQILLRKGQGLADEYAIAIRPVHKKLIHQAFPALIELSVKIFLIEDLDIKELT